MLLMQTVNIKQQTQDVQEDKFPLSFACCLSLLNAARALPSPTFRTLLLLHTSRRMGLFEWYEWSWLFLQ